MFAAPSSLHVANLTGLLWLRRECRGDPDAAPRLFGIRPEDAHGYATLSDDAIDALHGELDVSILVPRFDCQTLPAALAVSGQTPRERPLPPSDLELHNLANLQALRETCLQSNGDAVWTYRINQDTADAYRTLDHRRLVALCQSLTVSAFLPRYDSAQLARVLDTPAGARALYAAAYETDVAATSDAALRSVYLTR